MIQTQSSSNDSTVYRGKLDDIIGESTSRHAIRTPERLVEIGFRSVGILYVLTANKSRTNVCVHEIIYFAEKM